MSFTVEIEYKPSYHKKVNSKLAVIALEKAMNEVLSELYDVLTEQVKVKTGYLRDSHSHEAKVESDKVIGYVKNSAPYWIYVQFGTYKMRADPWITRSITLVQPHAFLGKKFQYFYGKL